MDDLEVPEVSPWLSGHLQPWRWPLRLAANAFNAASMASCVDTLVIGQLGGHHLSAQVSEKHETIITLMMEKLYA